MSRFLTPSKIALLALISLYTDSVVPSAATIPVLSFLVTHVLPTGSHPSINDPVLPKRHFTVAIDAFQSVTSAHASGIPGRTVWDLLLNKLWKINSFDALHVFFDTLTNLLQKTEEEEIQDAVNGGDTNPNRMLLSRVSPLGIFVRRAKLEFTKIQFHEIITLWKSFVAYRAPTLPQWKKRNSSAVATSFDVNLQQGGHGMEDPITKKVYGQHDDEAGKEASVSTEEVEALLDYQIDQMQRAGNRLPPEMKTQFRSMVETGVTVPSLSHYVEFLDAWKAGDYPSSFDNLHRYFDYTMHNKDRTFYQYALLNLAILHADFSNFAEAITAIQETIATARENSDMVCLHYSLSWLYHFGKAHPQYLDQVQRRGILGTDKEALAFLKTKAKETSMWSLLSTSLLSEATLTLRNGDSASQALESVLKASHINVTKNVINVVGSQIGLQSTIFGRLGVSYQSWLSGEVFLQCYASHSPAEDVLQSLCRSASVLAQKGRYEDALARMDEIDREVLRTLKFQQYWTAQLGLLKLRRQLYADNLPAATHILSQLHSSKHTSLDLLYSTTLLEIDLQIRLGAYPAAMRILESLATKISNDEADIFQRIRLMILKANIYSKAGVPQKGFSVALRAATLAHRSRILPALWEAINALCAVLHSVNEFEASAKLLESILPQVLECEDCNLSASSFSLLADAHVGMAGQAKAGSLQRKEQLTKGLENLGRAFDEFSRIGEVRGQGEMLAKKATVMHLNGDPVLANDCAAKYLAIRKAGGEEG